MKLKAIMIVHLFLCLSILLSGCSWESEKAEAPDLSKCINIGNSLEAPRYEPWDVPI